MSYGSAASSAFLAATDQPGKLSRLPSLGRADHALAFPDRLGLFSGDSLRVFAARAKSSARLPLPEDFQFPPGSAPISSIAAGRGSQSQATARGPATRGEVCSAVAKRTLRAARGIRHSRNDPLAHLTAVNGVVTKFLSDSEESVVLRHPIRSTK